MTLKIRFIVLFAISLQFLHIESNAIIINFRKPIWHNPWRSDSVYIGTGFFAKNSDLNIVVFFKKETMAFEAKGRMYFMVPNKEDSALFLFHNDTSLYPEEPRSIILGKFTPGTPIVFKFVIEDTSSDIFKSMYGITLYTGQNRLGMDTYISGGLSNRTGYCHFAGGRVNDSIVEGGFDDCLSQIFRSMQFEVSNVYLEVLEKNKIIKPYFSAQNGTYPGSFNTQILNPDSCFNSIRVGINGKCDTINPLKTGSILKSYYSDVAGFPNIPYSNFISVTQSKAYSCYSTIEGDTNWFPSEITSVDYVLTSTKANPRNTSLSKQNERVTVYTVAGKKVGTFWRKHESNSLTLDLAASTLSSGIYYFYAQNENVDKKAGRRVVWNRR